MKICIAPFRMPPINCRKTTPEKPFKVWAIPADWLGLVRPGFFSGPVFVSLSGESGAASFCVCSLNLPKKSPFYVF